MSVLRLVFLSLTLGGTMNAQERLPAQQNPRDPIRIMAYPRGVFVLRTGTSSSRIGLRNSLAGCSSGIYDSLDPQTRPSGGAAQTRVIDLVQQEGLWYLTFQASLNSGCNVQGRCGAGSSVSLVWLKLTPVLRVIAKQVEVVGDCLTDTSITDWTGKPGRQEEYADSPRFEMKGGKLEVQSISSSFIARTQTLSTVRYTHASPEKGLRVSSRSVASK